MVAGGNKKHVTTYKEDDTSTTSSLEIVLLTSIIYSEEGIYEAIINTPNAFIQTIIEH